MSDCRTASARVLVLLALGFLLIGCSGNSVPEDYHSETPWPHYMYLPAGYSTERAWPLFIAVHGSASDGRGCWELWHGYADEHGFVLLCPELADPGGSLHQLRANERLLAILGQVYEQHSLQPSIFLMGFSAGGQFVHGYAFLHPNYVKGVSVIAPGNAYPPPPDARHIPFLVIVGENDQAGNRDVARQLAVMLEQSGYQVKFQILDGMGHTVGDVALTETIDLFEQTIIDK